MDAAYWQRVRALRRHYQTVYAQRIAADAEGTFSAGQLALMRRVYQRESR